MARDWHGGGFQRLLRANVRVPHQTMGDFDAQIAANAIGALRVQELAARYGVGEAARPPWPALQDYSETPHARRASPQVPDGTYHGRGACSTMTGSASGPLPVRAAVTVAGDSITVDFAGTAPQVGSNLNAPFASDHLGRRLLPQGGADQPGHPLQRRRAAADHGDGAAGLPAEPAPSGAGAGAHGVVLRAPGTR